MAERSSEAGAMHIQDQETPLSLREQEANRAFRCSISGLVFWPLQLWTGLLLMCVVFAKEKLEGKWRRRAFVAGGIFLCFALLAPTLILWGLFYQPSPESDVRRLPRPAQLIGNWSGKAADKEGEFDVQMELHRNAKLIYREPEPPAIECTGSWGYEMPQLFVYYSAGKGVPNSWLNRVLAWDVERCTKTELTLRGGDLVLRLVRQN